MDVKSSPARKVPPGFKTREASFDSLGKLNDRRSSCSTSQEDVSGEVQLSHVVRESSEEIVPSKSGFVEHEESETSALSVREGSHFAETRHVDDDDDDEDDGLEHDEDQSWAPTRPDDSEEVRKTPTRANEAVPEEVEQAGSRRLREAPVAPKEFNEMDEDEDDEDDEGVADSPDVARHPAVQEVGDDADMESTSEYMIRVDTRTDLRMENPVAYLSDVSRSRSQESATEEAANSLVGDSPTKSPSKSSPSTPDKTDKSWVPETRKARPVSKTPPAKYTPSASLRVQHSDLWLNSFIMPPAKDEEKAIKLEAVGVASRALTPTKVVENKEVSTLRFQVQQTHAAVEALEVQLEEDLAKLKPQMNDAEFLKLVNRCLKLKQQALVACIEAAHRANTGK